ncbi:MAG: flagellar export chaperone FliS [Desulfovibrionaceae bacterium]|nr:flagellar export chaperone FliS [Desulfovibrionaceae bacterium]MDD4951873.1 flagellar export chaperone FliS [Desulfovibrionaceae bacterium]
MIKGAKAYLATQVETTSQGDLLLMLYDAAVKFLKQAKVKIVEKDFAQKGILISRALDIIHELAESLNREKGGELSQHLNQVYFFCSTRLARANIEMSTAMVDEVIGILGGMRNAFAQIMAESENSGRPALEKAPARPVNQTPGQDPPDQATNSRAALQYPRPAAPLGPEANPDQVEAADQDPNGPEDQTKQNTARQRALNAYSNPF